MSRQCTLGRADLLCLSEAFISLLHKSTIRFLFRTWSPPTNPVPNSNAVSLPPRRPPASSDLPAVGCCENAARARACVSVYCSSPEIRHFQNCFTLSFHSVGYIANRSLTPCTGMPPSRVNTAPPGLPTPFPHRFVPLHHQASGSPGSALAPRGSGGILPPGPQGLPAPSPGLPWPGEGGEGSSAPPILPLWGAEPVELG